MAKLWVHPQQVAILSSYLPHDILVDSRPLEAQIRLEGLLAQLSKHFYSQPGVMVKNPRRDNSYYNLLTTEVLPVLYALEDLAQQPAQLRQVVSGWDLFGQFKQYVQVTVLDSWLNHLTLSVKADGGHYEVKLSSWGDIYWRDVWADNRAAREAELAETPARWNALGGQKVLDTYELLRKLHIAVGPVSNGQQQLKEGKPWGEPTHYVRKPLSVVEEEGGLGNG